MPALLMTVICLWALAFSGMAAAQQGSPPPAFFESAADIPLMPGLYELPDSGFVFDQPEGRVVELAAEGNVRENDIKSFYNNMLPQLGWIPEVQDRYSRHGESLRVSVTVSEGRARAVFSIAPQEGR